MLERVKKHLKKHKELYVGIGIGVGLAGVTCLIVKDSHAKVLRAADSPLPLGGSGTVESFSFLPNWTVGDGNEIHNHIKTTVHKGTRGNAGFLTRNLETGQIFETQSAAAEAFGLSKANLSSHLNGKFEDVSGYHFERLGVLS